MYQTNRAFTLIELLVVVLIIGILAAVAVPQYKVAVGKARLTQLITLANSVVQAQERYYFANGEYTIDWTSLDIELNGTISNNQVINPTGWRLFLTANRVNVNQTDAVFATDSRLAGLTLLFAYPNGTWRGSRLCLAKADNPFANTLCKHATNKTTYQVQGGDHLYNF